MKVGKVFWGIILIFIGVIFLLENFEIINFSWQHVWRFWPIILIISGVNILFSRKQNNSATIIVFLVTIVSLIFLTYVGVKNKEYNSNRIYKEYWDDNETLNSSTYSEEFDENYKYATLDISGGASSFKLSTSTNKLFEANLDGLTTNYLLKKTSTDSLVNLAFSNKGIKDIKLKENGLGEVEMFLSDKPVWDINLAMGAGEADFDFRKFKIRNFNLKGGASEFDLKLGSLIDTVNVNVETGLASVKIDIPTEAGCRILYSSSLSSKNFEGFVEKGKGVYESNNYNQATKKIFLDIKGGLSELEVKRYN